MSTLTPAVSHPNDKQHPSGIRNRIHHRLCWPLRSDRDALICHSPRAIPATTKTDRPPSTGTAGSVGEGSSGSCALQIMVDNTIIVSNHNLPPLPLIH